MNKPIMLKIDSTKIGANLLSKNKFLEKFSELESLMKDDEKKYWILYEECNAFPWSIGQYAEVFWCIPISEITFVWDNEDGWIYVLKDYNTEEYNRKLKVYDTFEINLAHYILTDSRADETAFKLYKNIRAWVYTPDDTDIQDDNKMCLITYLETYWNAWLQSILNDEYKYMNLTQIVWESWSEI